jgi:hypothetical protein
LFFFQKSQWNEAHTQIITLTRLHVESWLKGSSATDIVLEQLGGTVDGVSSRVSGDARLSVGQRGVFFLRAQNGRVYLTALSLAVYFVDAPKKGPATVRRDLSDLTFVHLVEGRYVIGPPPVEAAETLEHLVDDITSIVKRQK